LDFENRIVELLGEKYNPEEDVLTTLIREFNFYKSNNKGKQ
jgi:hypothetical protein